MRTDGFGQPTKTAFARLSHVARVAFVALCAERLLPSYERFEREARIPPAPGFEADRVGSIRQLRRGLDLAWNLVDGVAVLPAAYRAAAQSLDDGTPDTEDFHTGGVSTALDAWVVVGLAVRLCLRDDPAIAAEAAELAADAAFAEAQRLEADSGLGELMKGPRVTAEVELQSASLAVLASVESPETGLSGRLRSVFSTPASTRG